MALKPVKDEAEKTGPTSFGYSLFRDHILPSVLGRHEEEILYWAGKELASSFPLFSMDEAPEFFREAGWGNLEQLSTGKKEIVFELSPDPEDVKKGQRCYSVEAGFLAGQYQKIYEQVSECRPEPDSKIGTIRLTLASE